MKRTNRIEQSIRENLSFAAGQELHERILSDVLAAHEKTNRAKSARADRPIWRIIMKSRMGKLAAAAVIVVAAVLSVNLLVSPAYALKHTIKANHTVRFLHMRDFRVGEDEPKEFWLECDEAGQIKNARAHMPEWASGGDGAKVWVWKEKILQVWFKKKNSLLIVNETAVAKRMLKVVEECDPRLAVERLYEQEQQGQVEIEIDEPSSRAEPIVVTATYLPGSPSANSRVVMFVDQGTKLVSYAESYRLEDGSYRHTSTQEYCDYNQQIAEEMFDIGDEVPSDVMRVDQTTGDVGLVQGQFSDEEIAVEVARQFFEALIASDYAKAGSLLEGIPAERMEQMFGDTKFLRIVSVGPVEPHPNPLTKGVVVPCVVEVEKNGEVSEVKLGRLGVRQVYNQPGRWTIFGGL